MSIEDEDVPEGLLHEEGNKFKISGLKSGDKVVITDPFESKKQELRDKQETIHENPDKPYVDIELPKKGKVGEKCVIKFSMKVPMAQIAISQDIQWKRRDKYDKSSDEELIAKAFILEEFKDTDKIEVPWADIGYIHEKEMNLLKAGEYLVEARGWSTSSGAETTAKRLIKVTKD